MRQAARGEQSPKETSHNVASAVQDLLLLNVFLHRAFTNLAIVEVIVIALTKAGSLPETNSWVVNHQI